MIRQLTPENSSEIDFVPHAIVRRPASYFAESLHMRLIHDADDLDEYEGILLVLNNDMPFALRHYAGHPADTVTIYLPSEYKNVHQITNILNRITRELRIDRSDICWQRIDSPGL